MSSTVEDRLRAASSDVHRAAESLPSRGSPRLRRSPAVAVAVGVLGVALLALPIVLTLGGDPPSSASLAPSASEDQLPTSDIPADLLEEAGPVLSDVRDYWSLQGTLESVGSEPGWLCPPRPNTGYSYPVDGSSVPSEILFHIPGEPPVTEGFSDSGPTCDQPPALTLLAFSDRSKLDTTAGLAIWPSLTRFEDECPPESCSAVGSPGEGTDTSPLEEVTINDRPALLFSYVGTYRLWWEDATGVPLYSVASGVTREELLSVAEAATVDPVDHLVSVPESLPAGLVMVERGPSLGIWQESFGHGQKFRIDDADIHVDVTSSVATGRLDTPYTRHAFNVGFSDLVAVNATVGVWIPEGGNHLFFTPAEGVLVSVEGAGSADQAIDIAERLVFGADPAR